MIVCISDDNCSFAFIVLFLSWVIILFHSVSVLILSSLNNLYVSDWFKPNCIPPNWHFSSYEASNGVDISIFSNINKSCSAYAINFFFSWTCFIDASNANLSSGVNSAPFCKSATFAFNKLNCWLTPSLFPFSDKDFFKEFISFCIWKTENTPSEIALDKSVKCS